MIRRFRDGAAEKLWNGETVKRFVAIRKQILRKLDMLDAALSLNDLRSPPANHLEALSGNRKGQHSIRINEQWRVCFRWGDEGAMDVEFVDYH